MDIVTQISVNPPNITGQFSIEGAEIKLAFVTNNDPDGKVVESLAYDVYTPAWDSLKPSEKFDRLAQICRLVESQPPPATSAQVKFNPEAKGTPA